MRFNVASVEGVYVLTGGHSRGTAGNNLIVAWSHVLLKICNDG